MLRCKLALFACLFQGVSALAETEPAPWPPVKVVLLPRVDGALDHMALSKETSRLFIAATGAGLISVVDLKTMHQVIQLKGLPKPQGLCVSADSERLMATCGGDGVCLLVDPKTLHQQGSVTFNEDSDNVRFDPVGKMFWAGFGSGGLGIIDPIAAKEVAEIKFDTHPEAFQLESKGTQGYVNLPLSGAIAVVDREKYKVVTQWHPKEAAGFYPMALDEDNHRLFVGCRRPARLLVLDTTNGKTVASVECVGEADDLYYDAKTKQIYVTGGAGSISLIRQMDVDHYALVRNIPTAEGARTSVFDPESGWLYVAVPGKGAQRSEIKIFNMRQSP